MKVNQSGLWRLGFRSFFIIGAGSSAVFIALWISVLNGWISKLGYLDPIIWHAHEMIYGFASAIIAGFVLTVVQNWTGIPGIRGLRLKILAAVWLLGRIGLLAWPTAHWVPALVDLAFFPMLLILLIPHLRSADVKIERFFFGFHILLLFTGNLLVQFDALGLMPGRAYTGIYLGLYAVLSVILFMAGRVVPFFTESSIAKAQPRERKWVEVASHLTLLVFVISQVFFFPSVFGTVAAFLAVVAHGIRLAGWWVKRVRRIPLIWVLHLGYLWIIIGFALTGFASLGWIARSLATHAFTAGGFGLIIYGMISRVSLGHTGRRLHPSYLTVVGYHLVSMAALVRVFGGLVLSPWYGIVLDVSAGLWVAAFVLFVWIYAPILCAPRPDGKTG